MKTICVAHSRTEAVETTRRLARECGGRLRDFCAVETAAKQHMPDGVIPERIVYVDGWRRGRRAEYVEQWVRSVAAKRISVSEQTITFS